MKTVNTNTQSQFNHSVVDQRIEKWKDFVNPESNQRFMLVVDIAPGLDDGRPLPWPQNKQKRIDFLWKKYQTMMQRLDWLDDDTVPYLDVLSGTEVFAEAFGCEIDRSEGQMPFALPLITKASEVHKIKIPDVMSSSIAHQFEIADELRKRAGHDALVRMIDVQSPMDIAALIWEKTSFYTAIIEEPDAVKELATKIKEFIINFLDLWFERYGQSFIAHFPSYYMEKGVTMSIDEIGCVSNSMFDEFYHDEVSEISQRYGGLGVHCCADANHQWKKLKQLPNFKLLNLYRKPDELKEAFEFFKGDIAQWHNWEGEGEPWLWPAQVSKETRVVIQAEARDEEHAKEICSKTQEAISNAELVLM